MLSFTCPGRKVYLHGIFDCWGQRYHHPSASPFCAGCVRWQSIINRQITRSPCWNHSTSDRCIRWGRVFVVYIPIFSLSYLLLLCGGNARGPAYSIKICIRVVCYLCLSSWFEPLLLLYLNSMLDLEQFIKEGRLRLRQSSAISFSRAQVLLKGVARRIGNHFQTKVLCCCYRDGAFNVLIARPWETKGGEGVVRTGLVRPLSVPICLILGPSQKSKFTVHIIISLPHTQHQPTIFWASNAHRKWLKVGFSLVQRLLDGHLLFALRPQRSQRGIITDWLMPMLFLMVLSSSWAVLEWGEPVLTNLIFPYLIWNSRKLGKGLGERV